MSIVPSPNGGGGSSILRMNATRIVRWLMLLCVAVSAVFVSSGYRSVLSLAGPDASPSHEEQELFLQPRQRAPLQRSVESHDTPRVVHNNRSIDNGSKTGSGATAVVCNGVPKEPKIPVCFLASSFFEWASFADRLQNVTKLFRNVTAADGEECHDLRYMKFFVFTNLPRLPTPGWTRIVQSLSDHNYTRIITHSRRPKFLGWQHPTVQRECSVVFYLDAVADLVASPSAYQRMAQRIRDSDVGLSQYLHRGGGGAAKEFRRVLYAKKDLPENVNASLAWLAAQPDYTGNCTLYENRYFGYDVRSEAFRKASTFFWDRYSKELDSWRDQPLWCYVLERFGIRPLPLPHEDLFSLNVRRMGKNKHKYGKESVGGAIEAQQKRNRRFQAGA